MGISVSTTFSNNSANRGGGVSVSHKSNVDISGKTTFSGNSASDDGGGVSARYSSNVNISGNTTFEGNTASDNGGGVHAEKNSNVDIIGNTIFSCNSAGDHGGGVHAEESSNLTISGNTTFGNNSASYGGGLRAWYSSNVSISGNTTFSGNSARYGGGVYASRSIDVHISGITTFGGNSASDDGGGVCTRYGSNVDISGVTTFSGNLASDNGGGVDVQYSSNVNISGRTTFANNSAVSSSGGGVEARYSNVDLRGNIIFSGNSARYGGGFDVSSKSNVYISGNATFSGNSASSYGGAVYVWYSSNVGTNGNTTFCNNSAVNGGGVFAENSSSVVISGNTTFSGNSAGLGGGVSAVFSSNVDISGTTIFSYNFALRGGGVRAQYSSNVAISGNTTFSYNFASVGGGVNVQDSSNVTVSGNTIFSGNSAKFGGGVSVQYSSNMDIEGNTTFSGNTAGAGGGVYTQYSSNMDISGNTTFSGNSASTGGGACAEYSSNVDISGTTIFSSNLASDLGGGVSATFGSNVNISGNTTFSNNSATDSGGGVYTLDSSNVDISGNSLFSGNSARKGGGIYESCDSVLNISGTSNFSSNSAVQGGAIFLNKNITLLLDETIFFTGNGHSAEVSSNGGAMFLDVTSTFIILPNTSVYWVNNHATLGGVIFVDQIPQVSFCSQTLLKKDCFFQLSEQNLSNINTQLVFINNSADAGSVLYGGAAQACTLFGLAQIKDDNTTSRICPDTVRICPCENSHLGCSIQSEITHSVYPGETFTLSVFTSSERNGKFPATVRSRIQDDLDSNLASSQYAQQTYIDTCTSLNYTIFSRSDFVLLQLYGVGPCSSSFSYALNISLNQNCPPGFNISEDKSCVCEPRLQKYTKLCNISNGNITRESGQQFWIGYDNQSHGLILHPYCPFDYCVDAIDFSLNDIDLQCANDRSGLLCGACKKGYSLVLDTSHCAKCTNSHLSLLIPFALMGVVLVFLLLICKLTVATGTLSGLVFYANIVRVNRYLFLPEESPTLSIFIAWLHLDFGIETCFYDGLDVYIKTWLQFVFPAYILVIVGLMILVSNYSNRFANMLGSNPIPILATLILLSYTKILRTLVAAMNITYLEYPTYNRTVWLYDANVDYLVGKHIPLFLVAVVVFLFLFLPYTLLLLFGQWLPAISHLKLFSWVNSARLKPFMDSYHAPYKTKHRYWPGLLLVLRFVLLLVFAIEISPQQDKTSINLLVILVGAGILQLWAWICGGVYKSWYLDALEGSFSLNLIILASATYYINLSSGSQLAAGYTSVSIAFVTFIAILAYHIFQQVRQTKLWKKVPKVNMKLNKLNIKAERGLNPPDRPCEVTPNINVTHTEIDLCELRSPLDMVDTK